MSTAELILASLCGGLIAAIALTTYWWYTVPKRYAENARQLRHLVRK